MSRIRHARRGALLAAVSATALAGAVATPAVAAKSQLVHRTPKVPIVVDGVRYAPQQIHRFDGRPLYLRMATDGESLIAYTKLSRFEAFLASQGSSLPSAADAAKPPLAHASSQGQWTQFCTDRRGYGHCSNLWSGQSISDTASLNGANWFNHWEFDDTISYVRSSPGQSVFLYDWPNFDPAGGWFWMAPGQELDLNRVSWEDRVESIIAPW